MPINGRWCADRERWASIAWAAYLASLEAFILREMIELSDGMDSWAPIASSAWLASWWFSLGAWVASMMAPNVSAREPGESR
ncbi:hypothetical protein ACYOEI_12160 [Singulisphaera rosea]